MRLVNYTQKRIVVNGGFALTNIFVFCINCSCRNSLWHKLQSFWGSALDEFSNWSSRADYRRDSSQERTLSIRKTYHSWRIASLGDLQIKHRRFPGRGYPRIELQIDERLNSLFLEENPVPPLT